MGNESFRMGTARIPRSLIPLACLASMLPGCGGGGTSPAPPPAASNPTWGQWGQNAQHTGAVGVAGQSLGRILGNATYDPFVDREQAETRGLLVHYQAALIDGGDVYMEIQSGTWTACSPPGSQQPFPCGPDAWNRKTWSEERLFWQGDQLRTAWAFESDWKPEPNGSGLGGWEPVFHAVIANGFVYVPGAGGTVYKLNRADGQAAARINPFGGVDPNTYVAGPLSADAQGNVYYNVLRLAATTDPWSEADAQGSWLVKVTPSDGASMVPYSSLVPRPPATCALAFSRDQLPWPPSPTAEPPTAPCGSQRPGVNVAPAIAADGTIYTVSRAHRNGRYGYLVAVNPDLTPRWAASLRGRLRDGCGVLVPIGTSLSPPTPNACREGTPSSGADPATNDAPAGLVSDLSSSSPTVLPDGSVLYGTYTRYNHSRGHLFKFSAQGQFVRSYDFGWDTTPAVYRHGGTYSVVIKDNHYEVGAYCDGGAVCAPAEGGPYSITQLDPNLVPEWKLQNIDGFEWCINAPAVDANGVVYANAEDGYLYAIAQGEGVMTTPRQRLFLHLALGAAYTPLALGPDGRIYTENDGQLFAVGN